MWTWKNTRLLTACTVALLASAPAHALIISKSNTNPVVVAGGGTPNDFATLLVDFNSGDFSGAADDLVQNLTVDIDFIKCNEALSSPLPLGCTDSASAAAASVSQIGFSLTDPLGTIIDLVFPTTSSTFGSYSDASPGGRIQVTFDDSAADTVGFTTPSFISGTFAPEGFLSTAFGNSAIGAWTLSIINTGAGDAPLGVARFAVNVAVNERQGPVITAPEPASTALLGLGLAGVMAFRRRGM